MEANVRTRPVLGVDVGKQSHWRCLVTVDGEGEVDEVAERIVAALGA